jgi:hypothetical protein
MYNPFFSWQSEQKHSYFRLLWFVVTYWRKKYRHELKPKWGISQWSIHTPVFSFSIWFDSLDNIWPWLKAHEPVFCALCLRLIFKKDATYTEMTTGRIVGLCGKCHNEIYHPYEGL